MHRPTPDSPTDRRERLCAGCRTERDAHAPIPLAHHSWPERVAEKVELKGRMVLAPTLILAIDDFRLFRMQSKMSAAGAQSDSTRHPKYNFRLPASFGNCVLIRARWFARSSGSTIAVAAWPSTRRARDPADTDFLPPGAPIAQRVVFGSDYEAGRRVHSSEPSSACARQITRHGFKVPRARSEPFRCRKRPENQISHTQWRF